MLKFYAFTLVVSAALLWHGEANAQARVTIPIAKSAIVLAQSADVSISPAEAADLAQSAVPGSKVLKVKLLPNGVYAVTLKADGSVMRVMVDGNSGSVQ